MKKINNKCLYCLKEINIKLETCSKECFKELHKYKTKVLGMK